MSEKLLLQVSFNSYRPKKDKSCSLNFITDLEVSSDDIKNFHELLDSRGILYYKNHGELTQEEVDELDNVDVELEGKTKSQRMRAVLFVYWTQLGEQGEFKEFYSIQMEKMIEHYKSKLDD